MRKKYTSLHRKQFLFVLLTVLLAGIICSLFFHLFLHDSFYSFSYRLFLWGSQRLFGMTQAEALSLYNLHSLAYTQLLTSIGTAAVMLVIFFFFIRRFATWLEQISAAAREVVTQTGTDIQLPKDLAPLKDDLISIQRQLHLREEENRESEQRKNDLIAFLAHDLKTPLTSVVGYLNLLHEQPDLVLPQRAKYIDIALDKAERLEDLLGEFFDITRLHLGGELGEMLPVQLSILLEQLADEFYPHLTQKELQYTSSISPHLQVLGAPDKLARVFDNVLRNAVSYSAPGGVVEIQAKKLGTTAEVTIRNEGLEIPEQELLNIFQRFYRLDAARSSRTGGAGLGLAIAKEIVEGHGGTIRAERSGSFTSFIITLPLHDT